MVKNYYFPLFILLAVLFSGVGLVVLTATSGDTAKNTVENFNFFEYKNGLGAQGYDVVSYFDKSEATLGNKAYQESFSGMEWRFSSKENQEKFLLDPARYLPRYGGHCAFAVAKGYLVFGDPQAWSIRDNILYFNYNAPTRRAWLANDKAFIERGDKEWTRINQQG